MYRDMLDNLRSNDQKKAEYGLDEFKSFFGFVKTTNYGDSRKLFFQDNVQFKSIINNLYYELHPRQIFEPIDIFKLSFPNIDLSKKLSLEDIAFLNSQEIFDENLILIAAAKDLFTDEAFKESEKRIFKGNIKQPPMHELPPKLQVDIDPIVLVQTKHGYLIATAWGDEANDETVLNKNFN